MLTSSWVTEDSYPETSCDFFLSFFFFFQSDRPAQFDARRKKSEDGLNSIYYIYDFLKYNTYFDQHCCSSFRSAFSAPVNKPALRLPQKRVKSCLEITFHTECD